MNIEELEMIIELWNKPIDTIQDWYNSYDDECFELLEKRENMEISETEFERRYTQSEHNKWIIKSIIDNL